MKATAATPPRRRVNSYVDGSSALDLGYVDEVEAPAPPVPGRPRTQPASAPVQRRPQTDGRPQTEGRPQTQRRPQTQGSPRGKARRQPWVTTVAEPEPAAPPLPVALPRAPFLILMVGLVVAGVLGVLVLNTKINENSFRLNDLRASQAALDLREQQLHQNLADLEAPGNLRAAATRLGLVPAGTPAFINLPDGRVVGVPQPASGR
jgi:hypothetical protein